MPRTGPGWSGWRGCLLRDDLAAEEVVQDAFIAVHRRWDTIRDHQAAAAYLRRAVVNGARSGLRHRGVEERYVAREQGEPTAYARHTEASAEDRALAVREPPAR